MCAVMLISLRLAGLRGSAEPDASPFLAISRQGTNVVVAWAFGDLQWATSLQGPWTTLSNAASPSVLPPPRRPGSFACDDR